MKLMDTGSLQVKPTNERLSAKQALLHDLGKVHESLTFI